MFHIARWLAVALLAGLAGCAHTVAVSPTIAPAAEISPGRRIAAAATYEFSPEITNWHPVARPIGLSGSAHSYSVNIASPLMKTLEDVINEAFTRSNPLVAGEPIRYKFKFDMEDHNIRIMFVPGFLSATALASVNVTLRVYALDGTGREITRALITGHGEANQVGGAQTMESVIAVAATRAMRKLGDDFVYKIINSGQLLAQKS